MMWSNRTRRKQIVRAESLYIKLEYEHSFLGGNCESSISSSRLTPRGKHQFSACIPWQMHLLQATSACCSGFAPMGQDPIDPRYSLMSKKLLQQKAKRSPTCWEKLPHVLWCAVNVYYIQMNYFKIQEHNNGYTTEIIFPCCTHVLMKFCVNIHSICSAISIKYRTCYWKWSNTL